MSFYRFKLVRLAYIILAFLAIACPATTVDNPSSSDPSDIPENKSPTDILLSKTSIAENQPINTVIGMLRTTDADARDSHTYRLIVGGSDFKIDGDSLRTSKSFDFETKKSYTIRIQTDDSKGGTFQKEFEITVNDVAEAEVFVETEAEKKQRLKLRKRWDDLMKNYYSGQITVSNFDTYMYIKKAVVNKTASPAVYELPTYTDNFKNYALDWWNFYKEIAQLNICEITDIDQAKASKAALICSANKAISHSPPRPPDMQDDIYTEGKQGAAGSNLFGATSWYSFHETVQFNFTEGKVRDKGSIKIPTAAAMGHRWNGLWYNNASVGFGYNHVNGYLTSTFMVANVNKTATPAAKFSAFPNGYYPIQAEMARTTKYMQSNFLDRRFEEGFRSDILFFGGHYCIWTIQQFKDHTFTAGESVTITIRDINDKGSIIDRMTCIVGQESQDDAKGSFVRVKNIGFAGGMTVTIKPKHGILSGAVKHVLGTNHKKPFHITIDGAGIDKPFTYRIIYYDIEHP